MTRYLAILLVLLGGCAIAPGDAEADREVVLKYLDAEVGTAGPFSRHGKKELEVLSEKDRAEALALLDRGAVGFLVFASDKGAAVYTAAGKAADTVAMTRIIFVLRGKVVGDFRAVKNEPDSERSASR